MKPDTSAPMEFQIVTNPGLDTSASVREQLVQCQCHYRYVVHVNGTTPISDTVMGGVACPNCGIPASEYRLLSGHSGGYFNVIHRNG